MTWSGILTHWNKEKKSLLDTCKLIWIYRNTLLGISCNSKKRTYFHLRYILHDLYYVFRLWWSARPEESMNRISLIFYYIVELQSPLSSLSKRKAILMFYYQPNLQGQARIFQNQITLVLLYSMSLKNLKYLSNGMLWMTLM